MARALARRHGSAVDLDRARGLELEHPVLNGSGTFDAIAALRTFGDEPANRFPFAAFVSKTITVEPRGGNPPPRLWETPAGMINSIGLPNKGLRASSSTTCPSWRRLPVPLIVSVAGFSHEEFAPLVGRGGRAAGGRGDRAERLAVRTSNPAA